MTGKANKNELVTEMVSAAKRIRSAELPEDDINREIESIYPGQKAVFNRSRLRRLCKITDEDFAKVEELSKNGADINEVGKSIPTVTGRGAPNGNKNGRFKRVAPLIDELNKLWSLADADTRSKFKRQNRLVSK